MSQLIKITYTESSYIELYAKLCKLLIQKNINVSCGRQNKDGQDNKDEQDKNAQDKSLSDDYRGSYNKHTFQNILATLIHKEFKKYNKIFMSINIGKNDLKNGKSLIKFIGCLYNIDILTPNIINNIIRYFIKVNNNIDNKNNIYTELICNLLLISGDNIDNKVYEHTINIISTYETKSRIKFLIMDVVDKAKKKTTRKIMMPTISALMAISHVSQIKITSTSTPAPVSTPAPASTPSVVYMRSTITHTQRQDKSNNYHQDKSNNYHQDKSNNYHQDKSNNYHQDKQSNYHQDKPNNYHQDKQSNYQRQNTYRRKNNYNKKKYNNRFQKYSNSEQRSDEYKPNYYNNRKHSNGKRGYNKYYKKVNI